MLQRDVLNLFRIIISATLKTRVKHWWRHWVNTGDDSDFNNEIKNTLNDNVPIKTQKSGNTKPHVNKILVNQTKLKIKNFIKSNGMCC